MATAIVTAMTTIASGGMASGHSVKAMMTTVIIAIIGTSVTIMARTSSFVLCPDERIMAATVTNTDNAVHRYPLQGEWGAQQGRIRYRAPTSSASR